MADPFTVLKQKETIDRAATAATLAIEATLVSAWGYKVPYEIDDREAVERFIRDRLIGRL